MPVSVYPFNVDEYERLVTTDGKTSRECHNESSRRSKRKKKDFDMLG